MTSALTTVAIRHVGAQTNALNRGILAIAVTKGEEIEPKTVKDAELWRRQNLDRTGTRTVSRIGSRIEPRIGSQKKRKKNPQNQIVYKIIINKK